MAASNELVFALNNTNEQTLVDDGKRTQDAAQAKSGALKAWVGAR